MNPLISVVLPIFNVEEYLLRCVDSVCNQTYSNLDIILVDDGSTDSCSRMCDEFARKDSRIRVLHKENGGLSDARNAGTEIARGEYITFIDPDDYVTKTYVEYLLSLIERYDARMALCTHVVIYGDGSRMLIGNGGSEVLSSKTCIERMLYGDVIDTSAWGKLYETEMAKSILYPKGRIFEDIATTYRFFDACGTIACGYEPQYYYILRNSSIVNQPFNIKKFDLIEMTDLMAENVLGKYPELWSAVERRRVYARFSTLNQMQNENRYQEKKRV